MSTKQKELQNLPIELQNIIDAAATNPNEHYDTRDFAGVRIPTLITTTKSLNNPKRVVSCWINPSQITRNVSQRGSLQNVQGGVVRYRWRNRHRDTFYDDPSFEYTFNSGNILPQRRDSRATIMVPPGLDNFYLFKDLLDEPNKTEDGKENFGIIYSATPAYPSLMVTGYFKPDAVSDVSESADNPWGVSWTAGFVVVNSTPSFFDVEQLRQAYCSNYKLSGNQRNIGLPVGVINERNKQEE